jgi:hypothetical protein
MRLIDADRALEIVRDQGIANPNAYHLTNYATLILIEGPTIDAVQVVRCKDCKYFMEYAKDYKALRVEGANGDCRLKLFYSEDMQFISCEYNDFCSYGERRENG